MGREGEEEWMQQLLKEQQRQAAKKKEVAATYEKFHSMINETSAMLPMRLGEDAQKKLREDAKRLVTPAFLASVREEGTARVKLVAVALLLEAGKGKKWYDSLEKSLIAQSRESKSEAHHWQRIIEGTAAPKKAVAKN